MAAATYNITIEQGATYTLSVVYKDSGGTPIDVTGCKAVMQVRTTFGTPDPALITATEADFIQVGTTDGAISVAIPETETINLTGKRARYDLYITFPNGGQTVRLLEGAVTIDPTVSNPTTA